MVVRAGMELVQRLRACLLACLLTCLLACKLASFLGSLLCFLQYMYVGAGNYPESPTHTPSSMTESSAFTERAVFFALNTSFSSVVKHDAKECRAADAFRKPAAN
jgi:hypothetical protein